MGRAVAITAVVCAALLGCGGNSQFRDLTAPYVGTWIIDSGTDTATCPGSTTTAPVTGSVIVNLGAEPLMLQVRDTNHGRCVWTLAVSAASATLRDGPSCLASTATSDATVVPRDYQMTLTAASSQATVTSTFDWTILDTTCRHAQQEHLVFMRTP
ncbi:MAG TPA: hypothetical protein VHL80_10080 [Polyangia bacterium]|nr:hypothetical protein [Polyangia bacterium]